MCQCQLYFIVLILYQSFWVFVDIICLKAVHVSETPEYGLGY